jgi:hypothetical protein
MKRRKVILVAAVLQTERDSIRSDFDAGTSYTIEEAVFAVDATIRRRGAFRESALMSDGRLVMCK